MQSRGCINILAGAACLQLMLRATSGALVHACLGVHDLWSMPAYPFAAVHGRMLSLVQHKSTIKRCAFVLASVRGPDKKRHSSSMPTPGSTDVVIFLNLVLSALAAVIRLAETFNIDPSRAGQTGPRGGVESLFVTLESGTLQLDSTDQTFPD